MRITWLGHSTVALQLDGTALLTDPVLRRVVGHLVRVGGPARLPEERVDAILVSHVHYDHLDLTSLVRVGRTVPAIVPRGAGALLRGRGFTNVVEVERGDERRIGAVTVRATHAEHRAKRGLLGPDVPSVGYLVSGSYRVYFAGDTDLFDGMSSLAPVDVALLPVAGWGPKLPPGHLDPDRAVRALELLRARVAVPIHWGTYRRIGLRRSPQHVRAPADEFVRLTRRLVPEVKVFLLPVGGSVELPATATHVPAGEAS